MFVSYGTSKKLKSKGVFMIAKVVPCNSQSKEFMVKIICGNQAFRLEYSGTKKECEWYAKQFRHALKKHTNNKLRIK